MKVVAFNSSPRKNGNTQKLIDVVLKELNNEGIETESIQIGGQLLRGCMSCRKCGVNKNNKCVYDDDDMNLYIQKMIEADGIVLASPTYFANVTTEMKALIDRAGIVTRANGHLLKRKVGVGIAAVRRAGSMNVLDAINRFFTINQVIVPGSSYWNMGYGRDLGDVENDEEGITTIKMLGNNMAWLMKNINHKI